MPDLFLQLSLDCRIRVFSGINSPRRVSQQLFLDGFAVLPDQQDIAIVIHGHHRDAFGMFYDLPRGLMPSALMTVSTLTLNARPLKT